MRAEREMRALAIAALCVAGGRLDAQQTAAAAAADSGRRAGASLAYDALLEGMTCRQQRSGRMDCEFRIGDAMRFVIAGVGQEDVSIAFVQADPASAFVASIVPLHGCIVVKPARIGESIRAAGLTPADSVATFGFVSPRTGKVYRNWPACLSATRGEPARADGRQDVRGDAAQRARQDSMKAAVAKAAPAGDSGKPTARPPAVKPPR